MADLRTLIDELQSNNQELLEQNEHLSNLSFEQKETNFNLSLIDDQLSMSNDIGITNQEIQLDSAAIAQDSIVSSASKKEAAADAGKGMTASFKKYLGAGSFLGKGFEEVLSPSSVPPPKLFPMRFASFATDWFIFSRTAEMQHKEKGQSGP